MKADSTFYNQTLTHYDKYYQICYEDDEGLKRLAGHYNTVGEAHLSLRELLDQYEDKGYFVAEINSIQTIRKVG